MALAHNALNRSLNAIIQQTPYVKTSTNPAHNARDIKDLGFCVSSWVKMVGHHHGTEESFIFPQMEKLSSKQGYMDDPHTPARGVSRRHTTIAGVRRVDHREAGELPLGGVGRHEGGCECFQQGFYGSTLLGNRFPSYHGGPRQRGTQEGLGTRIRNRRKAKHSGSVGESLVRPSRGRRTQVTVMCIPTDG